MAATQQNPVNTLSEQGYRFVHRDSGWQWVHPLEVRATDEDCTGMTDEEFEQHVCAQQPAVA